MDKSKVKFGLFASVAVVLAACSSEPTDELSNSGSSNEGESAGGDELIVAVANDAISLDPHGSNDTASTHIRTNIYDKLVNHDENIELQPELAESFEQIDDLTWEFVLREDVTFTDGEPFNAEAVKINLERVIDPEVASPKAFMYDMIDEIEVVDEYTVHVTTEYPFAPFAMNLTHDGGGMISPKAIEEHDNGERNLELEPVGTGSFQLDEWNQGESVRLVRNDEYWGELPEIEASTYKIVPDQSTRIAMLNNDEAHVIDEIEPVNTSQIETMDHADVETVESTRLNFIILNNDVEPFDQVEVRQAIAKAVDTETIVEGIYEGYGRAADGPVPPGVFGHTEDLDKNDYDLEEAQELLASAGYEDGFSTTLYVRDNDQINIQTAEYIQDQLGQIGIDISIEQREWSALLSAMGEGEHEMAIAGWTTVTGDADNATYSVFHSDNKGANGNRSFFDHEEADRLLDEAREESDPEVREQYYAEFQQIVLDESPLVFIANDPFRVGVHENVEGFIPLPIGVFDISQVRLQTDQY